MGSPLLGPSGSQDFLLCGPGFGVELNLIGRAPYLEIDARSSRLFATAIWPAVGSLPAELEEARTAGVLGEEAVEVVLLVVVAMADMVATEVVAPRPEAETEAVMLQEETGVADIDHHVSSRLTDVAATTDAGRTGWAPPVVAVEFGLICRHLHWSRQMSRAPRKMLLKGRIAVSRRAKRSTSRLIRDANVSWRRTTIPVRLIRVRNRLSYVARFARRSISLLNALFCVL